MALQAMHYSMKLANLVQAAHMLTQPICCVDIAKLTATTTFLKRLDEDYIHRAYDMETLHLGRSDP